MARSIVSPSLIVLVAVCIVSFAAAQLAPAAAPQLIPAERAAAIAVNRLEPTADGVLLRHPRRTVEFSSDGVRLTGRRGSPEWHWSLAAIADAEGHLIVGADPVAPVLVEQDLIRYDRCSLLEDYRLKEDSFEQLLVIPEPLPLGGEDLIVTGAVSCGGDLAETDAGWAWRTARGEVTLGRVTVLDAEGESITARFEVGPATTRIVVDGEALAVAAYPITIDPEIGSNDYRISDMGGVGDPSYGAFNAAVAYNSIDNEYLVVWEGDDNIDGLVDNEFEIFGQLLSATGGGLGSNDFRISQAGATGNPDYSARNPDVAFNSTFNQYLVVWTADTHLPYFIDDEYEIYGKVLDADGGTPFGGEFRISFNAGTGNEDYDAYKPAVAYNPDADEYLVVWMADDIVQGMVDEEFEIFAQRVYSTGILVGSNLRMSDMGGSGNPLFDAHDPDVTYNSRDHEYLIVWFGDDNSGGLVDDELEIFGQLITWQGVGTGPNDFRISDMGGTGDPDFDAVNPAVVYNERRHEYLVVWIGDDNVGGLVNDEFEVFSQRLSADAAGLGPNDFRLSDAGSIGDATYSVSSGPAIAYNPPLDRYMVVWSGEDDVGGMVDHEWEIFAQMVNGDVSNGIGPNDERISDMGGIGNMDYDAIWPVVAANPINGQFLVAWHGDDNVGGLVESEYEIFIQRMDGMAIFVDDFESGDLSAWTGTGP